MSKENGRKLPPAFLSSFLISKGYGSLPALSEQLKVSRSWLYKMAKTGKLKGRVGDMPKVLMTGTLTGACYWFLVDEVRALMERRL